ncbi:MAG: agmatinase [Gemmatimonadota bacterium]
MSRPVLLGVPYDAGASGQRGAALAPPRIRQALHDPSSNTFTESVVDVAGPGILEDAGDMVLTGETMLEDVEREVARQLEQARIPIVLGGDHSISLPVVRAVHRVRPGFALLHFDAHPDLYPEFQGNRFSHACPFARIMEEELTQNLVQLGIRTANAIQVEQARRFGVRTVVPDEWSRDWRYDGGLPVYISIDIDVLDPAFAPGVSHPEPGGVSTRHLLATLQRITAPIVGVDIVEYNPLNDPAGLTAFVTAKILKEVVGIVLRNGSV